MFAVRGGVHVILWLALALCLRHQAVMDTSLMKDMFSTLGFLNSFGREQGWENSSHVKCEVKCSYEEGSLAAHGER